MKARSTVPDNTVEVISQIVKDIQNAYKQHDTIVKSANELLFRLSLIDEGNIAR